MDVEFDNDDLDKLETDKTFKMGLSDALVNAYRKRVQSIRAAPDERTLAAVRGNKFENLKGNSSHQHSMRLNNQYRLIMEIKKGNPSNVIVIVGVEDYH